MTVWTKDFGHFWDPKLDQRITECCPQEQLLSELSKDDGGLDVAKFGVSVLCPEIMEMVSPTLDDTTNKAPGWNIPSM